MIFKNFSLVFFKFQVVDYLKILIFW